MRGALEGRVAVEPAAASGARAAGSLAAPAFLAAAAIVVGGGLLRSGGAQAGPLFWIGSAAIVAVATAATAVLAGALPRPAPGRAGVVLAASLAALAAWSAVTVVWSIEPDRSWDSFNRAAVYVTVLCLGALAGSVVRSAPRAAATLLAVLFAATIAWALLTVVVPALGPDVERSARLREPIGYWNALALVAAMALPLWLWLRRALGAVALFATTVALVLTTSRGGVLVAIVAVAVWLAVTPRRRESGWRLLVSVPPALAVGGWALTTAVADTGSAGDTAAGALLGAALVAGGALVYLLARRPAPAWAGRAAAALALAGLVAALAVAAPRLPHAWHEFENPPSAQVTNDPDRLRTLSSNHRWTWWTQAWTIFRAHPLGGAGAGTYELARRPIRKDPMGPLDPHQLGLKGLSELGGVGFLLLAAAVAAAVAVAVGALRRTAGEERAAVAALVAGAAAWLAQSLLDMPWEFAAATIPVAFAVGALTSAGRAPRAARARGLSATAVPAAIAVAAVGSLAFPWLAERRLDATFDALARGDLHAAQAAAQDARTLNPLSARAVTLEATALELMGRPAEARNAYEQAVRLQPENPDTWYELGRFELEQCNVPDALVYADRAWALDALTPDTGRLLNEARAALAGGDCAK